MSMKLIDLQQLTMTSWKSCDTYNLHFKTSEFKSALCLSPLYAYLAVFKYYMVLTPSSALSKYICLVCFYTGHPIILSAASSPWLLTVVLLSPCFLSGSRWPTVHDVIFCVSMDHAELDCSHMLTLWDTTISDCTFRFVHTMTVQHSCTYTAHYLFSFKQQWGKLR